MTHLNHSRYDMEEQGSKMHRYAALDSPLLRVSRPVAACSRCRSAKIKCDGKLPACTACEKNGRGSECSSSNDQFAKGKERSYVASLESRVEKLEKRIQYAKARKASVVMHDDEGPLAKPADRKDSLAAIRAAIHGKAARRREAVDVNELVSDFGFMTVNATMRDFDTQTTNLTFARLILAAALNEELPKPKSQPLPPRAISMRLIQYYLENVFCLYPAFPETALFHALDGVYSDPPRNLSEFEYWLLFMVLAIGSVAQSRSMNDKFYKDGVAWVVCALKHADHVLMPGYASQIQALILLAQYSTLDPRHFDSWHLAGFMCRAVVDLGFHQDPPKELQPEKKALETRRKIFYCAYALDRSISMVHARPFSFTDDATMVSFPSTLHSTYITTLSTSPILGSSTFNERPTQLSLSAASLLFELRKAQSTWYQELFQSSRQPLQNASQYLWNCCYEMRSWADKLPQSLPQPMMELFELELLYSYVYCLAPSCRFPAVSELGKTLIFEYSMQYIAKMSRISDQSRTPAFYTYHDALRVYFIGSQFLAVLKDNVENLLQGIIPYTAASSHPNAAPPPPIPVGRTDNVERSVGCIEGVERVLGVFGERWDDARALGGSFEMLSRDSYADLRGRLQANREQQEQRFKQEDEQNFMAGPVGMRRGFSGGSARSGQGGGQEQGQQQQGGWDLGKFSPGIGKVERWE